MTDAPTAALPAELAQVWAWSPALRDFAPLAARRVQADEYELEGGDVVRCELSDGELVVRERIFRAKLV